MFGLLLPTLLAALAARCVGGSIAHLAHLQVRWWWVIVAAFGMELVLFNPPINGQPWAHSVGPPLWVVIRIAMLGAFLRNAHTKGSWALSWLVIAGGMGLNTATIVANGGHMPQSPEAAIAVWGPEHLSTRDGRLENVVVMGPDTLLPWLGDILPEPRWLPKPNVVSAGDVLLALGVAGWVFGAIRSAPPPAGQPASASSIAFSTGRARPADQADAKVSP